MQGSAKPHRANVFLVGCKLDLKNGRGKVDPIGLLVHIYSSSSSYNQLRSDVL